MKETGDVIRGIIPKSLANSAHQIFQNMPLCLPSSQLCLLKEGAALLGVSLPKNALCMIESHLAMVHTWRNKINLVAYNNEKELITHHALDSLALAPFITKTTSVLDLGTGAGFPGMMLAPLFPKIQFTLLDSRQRRIEFLRLSNIQSKLQNINLVTSRIQSLKNNDNFDIIIARAVSSLLDLAQMTEHLRCANQRILAMKGLNPEQELAQLSNRYADKIANINVTKLDVPFLDAQRHLVDIQFH